MRLICQKINDGPPIFSNFIPFSHRFSGFFRSWLTYLLDLYFVIRLTHFIRKLFDSIPEIIQFVVGIEHVVVPKGGLEFFCDNFSPHDTEYL